MAYIDKEPIIEFITKGLNNPDKTKAFGHDAIEILTEIEYALTADVVEAKHGEWIHSGRGFDVRGDYECSICHSPSGIKRFYNGNKYSFCPDCGAMMDVMDILG